jgi:formate hydrogenlyase transcriptional activator
MVTFPRNLIDNLQGGLDSAASQRSEVDALEEVLRDPEELLTCMIEGSQDCIKILDLDGRLLSMNAGGLRALDICDFTALRDSLWFELWPPESQETVRHAILTARHGGVARFVGYCPTLQGKPKWWDVAVNAILDRQGRRERLLVISRDITDSKRTESLLRAVTEGTASVMGSAFYASLVQHLATSLQVRYVFVAECREPDRARVRAFWQERRFRENFEYDLQGTPCRDVAGGQVRCYSEKVQQLFPADKVLVDLGVESYLGVPAVSSAGRIVGHLVVLDDKPTEKDPLWISVLQTFAARVGAELERERAEERLREALSEVEALKNRLEAENVYLQEEIRTEHHFNEIVGNSPALLEALRKVELVASTDSTVLIVGETGCGKELFARAVHSRSRRSNRPLVKVNCGAIAPGLVESELFGHVKGAFTGAVEKRIGRFELANGGTIFLDEVGELPLEAQVKLLRVLQEQEFEPVGSSRTIRVAVRVIAATNRDLDHAVREGKFRADLLYRLNVFPIDVPPLRDRTSDISPLIGFFTAGLARRLGKPLQGFSARSMERLLQYAWPGNVRELQNVVERSAILSRGPILELEGMLLVGESTAGGNSPAQRVASPLSSGLNTLEDVERSHILSVLRITGGVVGGAKGAAAFLGLRPNTLRSRMKKLGISSQGALTAQSNGRHPSLSRPG